MKTITIINEKGGCGKTTIALHLTGALMSQGYRVLLIDADPQAHLTKALAPKMNRKYQSLSDFLFGDESKLPVNRYKRFGFVAGDSGMMKVTAENRRNIYKAIRASLDEIRNDYDIVILDSPGVSGMLQPVLVYLSDILLVPILPSLIDIRGAEKLFENYKKLTGLLAHTKPKIVINMTSKTRADFKNIEEAEKRFPGMVLNSRIRANKTLRGFTEQGTPIAYTKSAKIGTTDFQNLSVELLNIIENEI